MLEVLRTSLGETGVSGQNWRRLVAIHTSDLGIGLAVCRLAGVAMGRTFFSPAEQGSTMRARRMPK